MLSFFGFTAVAKSRPVNEATLPYCKGDFIAKKEKVLLHELVDLGNPIMNLFSFILIKIVTVLVLEYEMSENGLLI